MDVCDRVVMNSETRQRLEDLRREILRVREVLNTESAELTYLWQPDTHPCRRGLWMSRAVHEYSFGRTVGFSTGCGDLFQDGWYALSGSHWCSIVVQDNGARVVYDVFLYARNESACEKFRAYAFDIADALERCGWPPVVGSLHGVAVALTLFRLNQQTGRLHWTVNQQPGRPETQSRLASLGDVYSQIATYLSAILASNPPPDSAQSVQTVEPPGPERTDQRSSVSAAKKKRSTMRGEARVKLISALTKHHRYANGSCLNLEPIGCNELARRVSVAGSSASLLFKRKFKGYAKYRAICRAPSRLVDALKALNDEFSPHDLYGRRPVDEDDRDTEE